MLEKLCRIQKFLDGRYYPMVRFQLGPIEDFKNWAWVFVRGQAAPLRFRAIDDAQAVCDSWCRDHGYYQEPTFYCLFFDLRHTLEITGQSTVQFRNTGIPELNTIMR